MIISMRFSFVRLNEDGKKAFISGQTGPTDFLKKENLYFIYNYSKLKTAH